ILCGPLLADSNTARATGGATQRLGLGSHPRHRQFHPLPLAARHTGRRYSSETLSRAPPVSPRCWPDGIATRKPRAEDCSKGGRNKPKDGGDSRCQPDEIGEGRDGVKGLGIIKALCRHLATQSAVKDNPHGEVVGKILKSVFDSSSDEQKV